MKSFSDMTAADYGELGLRSGLEIHQQILTEKKLFCRCPAARYNDSHDVEILRHMRPTLSELGEYDGTALMEYKTKKEIIYRINHESVCTYEMDDTPPFEINQQALDIGLEIAMLLNYKLVSEIHIARKQYLDGSIPTGFQRTTIVGIDGWIPFRERRIDLIQLGLEEDSCREVEDNGHIRKYLTDRLGMPLIEMVTRPQMKSPQEVAEVANILRWLVRTTSKVRTGIGAARQDVNVSIKGGTRVEIKGVHRIPLIPKLIYNEARRQHALLQIRKELKKRGINEKSFHSGSADVTQIVSDTGWEPILQARRRGDEVYCVRLHGFKGIMRYETQTDKVFSGEVSDRVRVIACLSRLPNILTSDNAEETIGSHLWARIRKVLRAAPGDALILVWGNRVDVATAVQEIIIRAREATIGIPGETRQAMSDGTNGFERILPGPDRMYPDTDLPPLDISEKRIQKLGKNLNSDLWSNFEKYRKMDLPAHLVLTISASPNAELFEKFISENPHDAKRAARIMFETPVHWKRAGLPVQKLDKKFWEEFFEKVRRQPVLLEAGELLLKKYLKEKEFDLGAALSAYLPAKYDSDDIEALIQKIENGREALPRDNEKRVKFLMGRLMLQLRGHLAGEEVNKAVIKYLKSVKPQE